MALEREVEDPARYRLVVDWDSVECHMVDFRASEGFQRWRAATSPFFVAPPIVVHTQLANAWFADSPTTSGL